MKSAYGIRIHLSREKLVFNVVPKSVFLSSAYAYDCFCPPPRQFLPRDSITAVQVFTLSDFDGSHAANADISDYFKVYSQFSFTTIPDYLDEASWVIYDESGLEVQLDLLLMTAPSINTKHKFSVRLFLSDGRILEQQTTEIDLI